MVSLPRCMPRLLEKRRLTWAPDALKREDDIDLGVGMLVQVKVGDKVSKGDPLVTILAEDDTAVQAAVKRLKEAIQFSEKPVERLPLFYDVIGQV